MAINLTKNRQSMVNVWKEVVDDKNPINWALFGYEGQTNDLKVVSKGDGGIEELTEDLNSGKIMYGFVKLMDPKTSLPKCVLINWQGEGAPHSRKGVCANHIHDVAKLFSGAHITLNARNEDEVDKDAIVEKLAKAGSAYSFKSRIEPEKAAPVGTIYKRVNPIQEINTTERDKFWEREEIEEKQRRAAELEKRQEEQMKLEQERLKYEETTRMMMQQREEKWNATHPSPAANSSTTEAALKEIGAARHLSQSATVADDPSLKAQPPTDAFKNANGSTHSMQLSSDVRVAPVVAPTSHVPMQISPDSAHAEDEESLEEQDWEQTTPSVPAVPVVMEQEAPPTASDEAAYQAQAAAAEALTEGMADLQQYAPPISNLSAAQHQDQGLRARALYDYQAADATEISFDPDDIITHIDMIDEGWWQGLGPDGTFGLFPANYVEVIDD